MASLANACRVSARTAARTACRHSTSRSFTTSNQQWVASNFHMPAMSPTMTEGNIASWQVKEGDKFSAGDVLLEIETDKAQMDVEAQDDGVMAKIIEQDGAKSVKVGTRIAVFAEEGDDLSNLEIPADDSAQGASDRSASSAEQESSQSSTKEESNQQSQSSDSQQQTFQPSSSSSSSSSESPPHIEPSSGYYPLYPSVQRLVHTQGLSASQVSEIPATGPNKRLLKGDVLAYLGEIDKSYPQRQEERLQGMEHLDLTNIKKAKTSSPPKPSSSSSPQEPKDIPTQIAVPISFTSVYALQRRLQETLGNTLPLSTFIARASEIANENLPKARTPPTTDQLFDAVLGLNKNIARTSRGSYIPQITPLPPAAPVGPAVAERRPRKAPDVIDILATSSKPPSPAAVGIATAAAAAAAAATEVTAPAGNVFSVAASKGEERRARVYLERVKSVLEAEPGRCVL